VRFTLCSDYRKILPDIYDNSSRRTDGPPKGPDGPPNGPDGPPNGPDGQPNGPDGPPNGPDGKLNSPDGPPKGPDSGAGDRMDNVTPIFVIWDQYSLNDCRTRFEFLAISSILIFGMYYRKYCRKFYANIYDNKRAA